MPRKFPISAVVGFAFGAIALLMWLLLRELFAVLWYILIRLFLGIDIYANVDVICFTVLPAAFVSCCVLVSVLSLLLRKYASDRVYHILKKLCDVLVTLLVAPPTLLAVWFPITALTAYTWEWCAKNGNVPLEMVFLLIPVFFVFFLKVKFRINIAVGNTILSIALVAYIIAAINYIKYGVTYDHDSFVSFVNATDSNIILISFCALSFVILWLFEQIQRSSGGRLNMLSRILLTAIAVLSALYVCAENLNLFYTNAWSWRQTNSLLFAIPIFALFVAYIVKVNRISCHPEACRRICGL